MAHGLEQITIRTIEESFYDNGARKITHTDSALQDPPVEFAVPGVEGTIFADIDEFGLVIHTGDFEDELTVELFFNPPRVGVVRKADDESKWDPTTHMVIIAK